MPYEPNKTLLQTFEWHTATKLESRNGVPHYTRLCKILPSLKALGITTIWLPPGCKANNPHGNGYDSYDLWDLGEFDQKGARSTKWGNREDLDSLLAAAKGAGVECLWDAVLNHKAGADAVEEGVWAVEVDGQDRRIEVKDAEKIDAWLRFDFPGRSEQYSATKWRAEHFNGTDWDHRSRRNRIFKLIDEPRCDTVPEQKTSRLVSLTNRLRDILPSFSTSKLSFRSAETSHSSRKRPGKDWASDVDSENGNSDYLMFSNVDYKHPEVRADVKRWGKWMIDEVGVDGFRLDAARHFSRNFTREWIAEVQGASTRKHGRDVMIVGEVWTGDVRKILRWLDAVDPIADDPRSAPPGRLQRVKENQEDAAGDGLVVRSSPQIFAYDAPLLYAFSHLSALLPSHGTTFDTTSSSLVTSSSPEPPKSGMSPRKSPSAIPTFRSLDQGTLASIRPNSAITLVTNHDTQPGQTCHVSMPRATKMLWYAYILLREQGLPCVFWGDLFGTRGPEAEDPVGLGKSHLGLGVLIGIRSRFAYGAQCDYFADGGRVMGWTREGRSTVPLSGGIAVVISISSMALGNIEMDEADEEVEAPLQQVEMKIGHPEESYVNVFATGNDFDTGQDKVVIDETGAGKFGCRSWTVAVYVREDAVSMVKELRNVEACLKEIYDGCI